MLFDANNYREAAKERITAARFLQSAGVYGIASYIAGRAVESLFIGYLVKNNALHECGHDVWCLYRKCRINAVIPVDQAEAFGEAVGDVHNRWANDHRFRSEDTFRRFLRDQKMNRGIKGDYSKENCRILVDAAEYIVALGDEKW